MEKRKYPTSFLKDRRKALGLKPHEAASLIGVPCVTYRQWEHRSDLPESHFPAIAKAFQVTQDELRAEKIATMMFVVFKIPRSETRAFILKAPREVTK